MIDCLNTLLRKFPTWPVYVLFSALPLWWLWQGLTGQTGPDPVKVLEHTLGKAGFQLLLASLAVTPLRRYLGLNLLRFRRALGLMAFLYITLHLLTWLVLDVQIPAQMVADIIKRPFVTIGMLGFVLLVPLAWTSRDAAIRRMGPAWRKLHKLAYAAALLGGVHYIWQAKGLQLEPLAYTAGLILLLVLRLRRVQASYAQWRGVGRA